MIYTVIYQHFNCTIYRDNINVYVKIYVYIHEYFFKLNHKFEPLNEYWHWYKVDQYNFLKIHNKYIYSENEGNVWFSLSGTYSNRYYWISFLSSYLHTLLDLK